MYVDNCDQGSKWSNDQTHDGRIRSENELKRTISSGNLMICKS